MNRMPIISNAVLWAGAILASAILGGPPILMAVLLPTLAACALITIAERNPRCIRDSMLSGSRATVRKSAPGPREVRP